MRRFDYFSIPIAPFRRQEAKRDNAPELISACKKMDWIPKTSTPGVPHTNGLAEQNIYVTKAWTFK